jgi:TolB protein
MRLLVLAALAMTACRDRAAPRAAASHDAAAGGVVAPIVDAAPPAPPRPPLADDERAALPGTIHVAAGREGHYRIVALDPSGRAPPRTVSPDDASYYPAPGPLPLAIATIDHGSLHQEQLVLLGQTPADARPLGPRSARVRSPDVSRDRATIVFEADTASFRDLYRLDVASGAMSRLTDAEHGNFEPSLSPDGARVAFTSSRDGDAEIYVAPVAGGAPTRLTIFHKDDWLPRWSPDGAWIAFVSDREGAPRVFLVRPDGTGLRPAHAGAVAGEELEPSWAPDGSRLGFVVSTRAGASEIWVVEVDSGAVVRVSAEGARDEAPAWSPDGRHLVFVSTRDRRIDLWIVRADGSAESRLTDTPEEEWIPRWRP